MRQITTALSVASLFATMFFVPTHGLADGSEGQSAAPQPIATAGSDASFDNRLPPVLPGETVADSGKKMKVWSTGGSLPANEPPHPGEDCRHWVEGQPGCGREEIPTGLGIVVDQRRDGPR